jgi:hypothetical protein
MCCYYLPPQNPQKRRNKIWLFHNFSRCVVIKTTHPIYDENERFALVKMGKNEKKIYVLTEAFGAHAAQAEAFAPLSHTVDFTGATTC